MRGLSPDDGQSGAVNLSIATPACNAATIAETPVPGPPETAEVAA